MTRSAPTPEAIDAALAPLAEAEALLLAVSGGPDSTALLAMTVEWARRRGGPRLEAATIDHGLRATSAVEADAVARLCAKLGVPHATLIWSGEKPKTRVQERARAARYELLTQRARAVGARCIVTAHHLDDQAETVLFRLIRGSGVAGLAGIAALSTRDGIMLARPLLGFSKAELVEFCRARRIDFVDDPSNTDPKYARTRMRAALTALAAEGFDAPSLARLARRAAQVECALARQTESAESRLRLVATGRCEARALLAEPVEIAQRLLANAISRYGGRAPNLLSLEKIEQIAAALRAALAHGERFSANVAGARVRGDGASQITVEPEPARRGARKS